MIKGVKESGLRWWIFFEKSNYAILFTFWTKEFPYMTLSVCLTKKGYWIDL